MPKVVHKIKLKTKKSRPEYDRAVFDILRSIRGLTAKVVAEKSGLSAQTITNIRKGPKYGGTRWPRHYTMTALAKACGMEYRLVPSGSNSALFSEQEKTKDTVPSLKIKNRKIKSKVKKMPKIEHKIEVNLDGGDGVVVDFPSKKLAG